MSDETAMGDGGDGALVCVGAPAAAQDQAEETVIEIIRGGAGAADIQIVRPGGASRTGVQPRLVRIMPEPVADPAPRPSAAEIADAKLAGAAEPAAAAAAEAPPEDTGIEIIRDGAADAPVADTASGVVAGEAAAAAASVVSAGAAAGAAVVTQTTSAVRRAVSPQRTADLNRIVLSALACSTAAQDNCADDDAGLPGAALTASLGEHGTPQQQAVAGVFRDLMATVWIEQQQRAIVLIGYYSAAAALCENTELSPEDVARVVRANFTVASRTTDEQQRYRHDALTMHIGIATGLAMGAHLDRVSAFCAEAQGNRHNFATPLLRMPEGPVLSAEAQVSVSAPLPPPPLPDAVEQVEPAALTE